MCAKFGFDCVVYMGAEDMARQRPNVDRMYLLGAEVVPVEYGTKTLREATSEAIRDWIANVETTTTCSVPVSGRIRIPSSSASSRPSSAARLRNRSSSSSAACPMQRSRASAAARTIGLFAGFLDDDVELVGVAANAASLGSGRAGVLHGARSSLLADEDGQVLDAESISAGLDYPGVGPSTHSCATPAGRATCRRPTRRHSLRSAGSRKPRGSSPRSSRRTRSRGSTTSTPS